MNVYILNSNAEALGVAAAIPASLKAQGWSNARAFSATQLRQNPNAFFYRNVAPDQEQVVFLHLLCLLRHKRACCANLMFHSMPCMPRPLFTQRVFMPCSTQAP